MLDGIAAVVGRSTLEVVAVAVLGVGCWVLLLVGERQRARCESWCSHGRVEMKVDVVGGRGW
jgi:hypothetical protein